MKNLFDANENIFDNFSFDQLPEQEMNQLKGGYAPKEKDIYEPEDK